jgi:hypothetical protein
VIVDEDSRRLRDEACSARRLPKPSLGCAAGHHGALARHGKIDSHPLGLLLDRRSGKLRIGLSEYHRRVLMTRGWRLAWKAWTTRSRSTGSDPSSAMRRVDELEPVHTPTVAVIFASKAGRRVKARIGKCLAMIVGDWCPECGCANWASSRGAQTKVGTQCRPSTRLTTRGANHYLTRPRSRRHRHPPRTTAAGETMTLKSLRRQRPSHAPA